MKKILTTPVTEDAVRSLRAGDTVYVTGDIATCRDAGHHRMLFEGVVPEGYSLDGGVIFHAGPIAEKRNDGSFKMIAVGPTTSMRMESVEAEFIKKTGVRLLIGKGGMGEKTAEACREFCAVHLAYPGGCGVMAATQTEAVTGVDWLDLGMAEAFWKLRVREFGPLIVTIDTQGNNLFEQNRQIFRKRYEDGRGR